MVCQVTDDMPAYEVHKEGGNLKVVHWNRLFLVATLQSDATPLGGSEFLSSDNAARSTIAELTPCECDCEVLESQIDEVVTLRLASKVLLGWVDGILWPLPTVTSVST